MWNGAEAGWLLRMPDARQELWSFLTPAIGEVARAEVERNASRRGRERKLIEPLRFFGNLLSSQSLAFNLFGESAGDLSRATEAARRLWPERVGSVSRVEFEWSPGRQDPRYLDNGTSADVAIFHTTPRGGQGLICIETKYHEDLSGKDSVLKPRYEEVTRATGVLAEEHVGRVRAGRLQQMWLDHLLALVTALTDALGSVLFVFLYPSENPVCARAAVDYRECLSDQGAQSFEARTLEDVVATMGPAIGSSWMEAFCERYFARER